MRLFVLVAMLAGCASSPQQMTSADLCAQKGGFTVLESTARAVDAEIERRGLLCSGQARQAWNKPGATEADFQQAQARCRMYAAGLPREQRPLLPPPNNFSAMGDALMEIGRSQQFMNDCMTADGWRR